MADLVIRPSIKGVVVSYVISTLLLIGIVVFLNSRGFKPVELWALIVIPLGIDIRASIRHVRLNSRRVTLDQGVLRYEDGIFSKTQRNLMLDKIRDVRVEQTAGQRLVGVGNLTIEALGESGAIMLENVDRPREVADALLNAVRQYRPSQR